MNAEVDMSEKKNLTHNVGALMLKIEME